MDDSFEEEINRGLVAKANEMLEYMHTNKQLMRWQDIDHTVFVALYEGLCAETLRDKIDLPRTPEDEAHNIQAVIDAISMDIVNTSLSHITGEEIVNGNRSAISNLLDVFSWMLEYILERISVDGASEKDLAELYEDDPDRITSDFIDDILDKEINNGRHSHLEISKPEITWELPDTTADYIALGNTSDTSLKSANDTQELIALGKSPLEHRSRALYNEESTNDLLKESEDLERRIRDLSPHTKAVLARIEEKYNQSSAPNTPKSSNSNIQDKSKTDSYEHLDHLVCQTVDLTRSAIKEGGHRLKKSLSGGDTTGMSSSSSRSMMDSTSGTDAEEDLSEALKRTLRRLHNEAETIYKTSEEIHDKANRKVTFSTNNSREDISSKPSRENYSKNASPEKDASKESHETSVQNSREKFSKYSSPERVASKESHKTSVQYSREKFSKNASPEKVASKESHKTSVQNSSKSVENWDDSARKVSSRRASTKTPGGSKIKHATVDFTPEEMTKSALRFLEKAHRVEIDPDRMPTNFTEYLSKYYGDVGTLDINSKKIEDSDSPGQIKYQDDESGRKSSVRYADEDYCSFSDTDQFIPGTLSSKIMSDNIAANERTKLFERNLRLIYQREFDDFTGDVNDRMEHLRISAKDREVEFKRKALHPFKVNYQMARKYMAKPQQKKKKPPCESDSPKKKANPSMQPTSWQEAFDDSNLLPWLLESFPYLNLSPQFLQRLWIKSTRQLELLSKGFHDVASRKGKGMIWIQEAERRQRLLAEIMRKEFQHNKTMRDLNERRLRSTLVKSKIRERRTHAALSKKYYDDYQLRIRSRKMKKLSKEELMFRHLFDDSLKMQKDYLKDLKHYTREKRQQRNKKLQLDLKSIETYFQDKYALFAKQVAKEREELKLGEREQQIIVEQMKKELRDKMEHEIKTIQDQLCQDDDDEFIRLLETKRMKEKLSLPNMELRI